jgi:hypothetical protein
LFIVTSTAARPQGESGRAARKDRSVNDASKQCQRRAANKAAFTSSDVVDVPILDPEMFDATAGVAPAGALLETPIGFLTGWLSGPAFDAVGCGATGVGATDFDATDFAGGALAAVAGAPGAGLASALGADLGSASFLSAGLAGFADVAPSFLAFVAPACGPCRWPERRSACIFSNRSLANALSSSFVTD